MKIPFKNIIVLFTLITSMVFQPILAQKTGTKEYNLIIKTYITGTKSNIKSTLELKDISTSHGFQGKGQTNNEGLFSFKLNHGAVLQIKAVSSGYMPTTIVINPNTIDLTIDSTIRIELTKIEVGTLIELKNVNFERGAYDLLPESYMILNDLVTLLESNTKMKIELAGHTDAIGGTQTNLKLSENRVESVKKFLTDNGIKSNRVKGVGYGGKRPVAKNNTEEGREKNRRVEFKVLKIK